MLTQTQLQIALARLREVRPWEEMAADVQAIQQGLQARLGCPVGAEDAIFAWECFSEFYYAAGWLVVHRDFLDGCATMLQAAYDFVMRQDDPDA